MKTLLQDIIALLAIINPLGAIPAFFTITERMESEPRFFSPVCTVLRPVPERR